MSQWDAGIYLKFADERTQPSLDLIQRINLPAPRRIIDLGCGPGNSTDALRRRWPQSAIAGLDNSAPMIEAARRTYPHGIWELGDVESWRADEPFDLVFSNALLQWLPDHAELCARLSLIDAREFQSNMPRRKPYQNWPRKPSAVTLP